MRCVGLLLSLLAACSSGPPVPADLASGPPACLFTWSGDASGTRPCYARFCRQPTSDSIVLSGNIPPGPNAELTLGGPFTPARSYTAADLESFDAGFHEFSGTAYIAGSSVAGTTVTITVTDAEQNPGEPCGPNGDGTAHGTAHIGLVEVLDDDAGARSPGHVMLDAVF